MTIGELRKEYHQRICNEILVIKSPKKAQQEYPNFADASNPSSIRIARAVVKHLEYPIEKVNDHHQRWWLELLHLEGALLLS